MSKVTKERQRVLIESLTDLGYGQAETESRGTFEKRFYPVPEHMRAFEPEVVLVVGDRGSGKTALFRGVFENELLHSISPPAGAARLPPSHAVRWMPAYPLGSEFAEPLGLKSFIQQHGTEPQRVVELWLAYLARLLAPRFLEHIASARGQHLQPLLDAPAADPIAVHAAFAAASTHVMVALDTLDKSLLASDEWLFVGYDELDTLGGFDLDTMAGAITGLIGFWAAYARRWKRLRAKIFIRSDLFRRHAGLGGADLAKLAANRAELRWNDRNLFAMLIKRIANTSDELQRYCTGAKISFSQDPTLGWIPELRDAAQAKPLIVRMIGAYMGANAKKGLSFRWVLDHIRDGHGAAAPRALVRLFEQAAQKERGNPSQRPPHLLHPTSLRQALEDVSHDHVNQAMSSEWPWLYGVTSRLQGSRVPLDRKDVEAMLRQGWDESWAQHGTIRPPASHPGELIDYLVELGVLRERTSGQVDVPDLFLFGLGLKRRGGVARKR